MHRFSDVVKGLIVSAIVFVSGPPAGLAHEDEEPLHLIQTSATAEEDVTPDSVSLSLEVMTQAETVEQARSENAERMGRLLEAVKAHGWKELTTQTGRFSVTPVYEKIDRKFIQDLPKILGYQISHLLVVKLEALDGATLAARVTVLLDEGMRLGANQVYGPSFYVKDPDPIRERLLAEAVRDAKQRAQLMAEAAGVTLGRLQLLADQAQPVYRARHEMAYAGVSMAMSDSATPIEVGEQTISVTVSVSYEVGAP